jgi:hypothetical protein
VAGSCVFSFGRAGSLKHEAPLVEFLLQDGLGDHLGFVLSDERGREVAAHGIFHDLVILGAAEQDTDCRAALKYRICTSLFSTIFREFTTSLLHLNPALLYLNPGRSLC